VACGHYWCQADRSGFWFLPWRSPQRDWHLDTVGRALAFGSGHQGPGPGSSVLSSNKWGHQSLLCLAHELSGKRVCKSFEENHGERGSYGLGYPLRSLKTRGRGGEEADRSQVAELLPLP
jgi:hypothetical protein